MKETENLNLPLIEGTDVPSYAPFNEAMNKIDSNSKTTDDKVTSVETEIEATNNRVEAVEDNNNSLTNELHLFEETLENNVTLAQKNEQNITNVNNNLKSFISESKLKGFLGFIASRGDYDDTITYRKDLNLTKNATLVKSTDNAFAGINGDGFVKFNFTGFVRVTAEVEMGTTGDGHDTHFQVLKNPSYTDYSGNYTVQGDMLVNSASLGSHFLSVILNVTPNETYCFNLSAVSYDSNTVSYAERAPIMYFERLT